MKVNLNMQTEPHIPDEAIMADFFLSEGFSNEAFHEALHLIDEAGAEKISPDAPFSILPRSPL